ncbi:hypothetical protein [Methylicorpusculum sp.]|uniref:hypothetical protein n=1 Tax=Methylicorpusculum sp. TaxID=2713644 RepID=UPI00271F3CBD|nr:hypothetical protein [Methylicorpusculum sp.]MDO9241061.1 hypothetical protein [Methylicorpusculum sp.]MDP2179974.1 hypothetical protein [Methylicorpusculum sp.]MDP3527827.1 hypothetical protein [Methylicorpusculum sp.]MDZ4154060.1 hypothetical protein [Methylicorpusculum sp.]
MSIGVARFPAYGADIDTLTKNADARDVFISIAEDTGLIIELGEFVKSKGVR